MTLGRRGPVRLFIAAVVALAVGAAVLVGTMSAGSPAVPDGRPALAVLIVFLFVGELHSLKWLTLDDGGEITPSWGFAFSILLMPAPLLAVIAMATASAVGDVIHRKPLERVIFNSGQTALSLAGAAVVMISLDQTDALVSPGRLTAGWFVTAALAATTMFILNGLLTCIVLALHEGTRVLTMLRRGLFLNLVTDGALVALAPVFVVVAHRSVLLLPLVIGVAALVHYNTRAVLAVEHEASHDVLTHLWNRRAFVARMEREFADRKRERQCALILIDLDGFKEINDRLGHQVGDTVLAELGARLRAAQRPGQLAARLGGDEFAVFCTQFADLGEVTAWAETMREDLSRPCVSAGFPVSLTASLGIALWPDHGTELDTLIRAADLAMYGAKRARNTVQVCRESAVGAGRITLMAELEAGISKGELTLWYQPQVDLLTGEVVALEALARWNHPRLGLVMPDEFMPLAEHTELMGPITKLCLDMAVGDALTWRSSFPAVRVAVNASARNLHDLSFAKAVQAALRGHDAPADILELEITENTVISQPERTRVVLEALEDLGVRLSIDDFGTGYSSLASLRSLPVRAIKIDRSFVQDLSVDQGDRMIVKSIIELAHNLGLETVAEGVESEESLETLTHFGCDFIQGYLVGHPMPVAQALLWLSAHRGDPYAQGGGGFRSGPGRAGHS